jgi:hypothetical protein
MRYEENPNAWGGKRESPDRMDARAGGSAHGTLDSGLCSGLDRRSEKEAVTCFVRDGVRRQARDDAGLLDDQRLRAGIKGYFR